VTSSVNETTEQASARRDFEFFHELLDLLRTGEIEAARKKTVDVNTVEGTATVETIAETNLRGQLTVSSKVIDNLRIVKLTKFPKVALP